MNFKITFTQVRNFEKKYMYEMILKKLIFTKLDYIVKFEIIGVAYARPRVNLGNMY